MIKAKLVLWPAQKDQTRHGRSEIIEGERVVVCETIEDPWRCCAALWTPKKVCESTSARFTINP